MKKIYLPSNEEMKIIQLLSGNDKLYKYILTKSVEKMISEGQLIKNGDKELISIPELAIAICNIYPQEIGYSDIAKNDLNLFTRLLSTELDYSNNNINYLSVASKDIQYNESIVLQLLKALNNKLYKDPTYRFSYRESDILNSIFEVDYLKFKNYNDQIKDILMMIDPIYVIKFLKERDLSKEVVKEEGNRLSSKIDTYSSRYGIFQSVGYEYKHIDIIKRPDEKVKKLVKYINKQ